MKIHHVAIWTQNLENMKDFYVKYFDGTPNQKYVNPKKGFESYFIRFDNEISIEIMRRTDVVSKNSVEHLGFCHLALAFDTKEDVTALTEKLRRSGYTIASETRTSGDGYFESVILDPDGNRIELVTQNLL